MRNTVEIKVWMMRNNLSVGKIQKALGYKTHTGISNTLAGRENMPKVLRFLLKRGCPVEYLNLPAAMKERNNK